jgi:hypothetical protein
LQIPTSGRFIALLIEKPKLGIEAKILFVLYKKVEALRLRSGPKPALFMVKKGGRPNISALTISPFIDLSCLYFINLK